MPQTEPGPGLVEAIEDAADYFDAVEVFFERQAIEDARASVALDHDPAAHTCSMECDEYPECPASKKRGSEMAETRVLECPCQSPFQDKRYGYGKRLHNKTVKDKGGNKKEWRCSVCGRERDE